MKILAEGISKKFGQHPIFKNVNLEFENQNRYALLGSNGSGKSTLLRILATIQSPSKGIISYSNNGEIIAAENVFRCLSFCAPAMALIEEMTLSEMLTFHFSFKAILPDLDIPKIIELTGLQNSAHKQLGDFSSGMKQRVKLAQAIFTDTPILMLDEPCSNLDAKGVQQYQSWIELFAKNKMIIVASNDEREYEFCSSIIEVENLK